MYYSKSSKFISGISSSLEILYRFFRMELPENEYECGISNNECFSIKNISSLDPFRFDLFLNQLWK